jgi:predicted RNase H-like nuclease (RuvC/YqgF family)
VEHYKRYKTEKDALNLPPTLPGTSLEQELKNRRLQSEILRERQQKEDLERQVQELRIQNQNLKLQVEQHEPPMTTAEIGSWMYDLQGIDLQLQIQDPQAQQNLQQAQQFQFQNSELQVEDLQRPVQDQQTQQSLQHAQQCLQQAQQFQALDLQPQPQPSSLQQHQREEELFTIDENCAVPFGTEPFQEEAGFGADIDEWMNMEPF